MQFKHLSFAALLGFASAQTQGLNDTVAGNNGTSALAALLGQFPALVNTLNGLSNITVLAPSNDALSELLSSPGAASLATNPGFVQALLSYHVLNGTYPASSITNTSAFVPTLLNNSTYTNVTGGQVIEAVTVDNNVTFYSGRLQNASVTQANLNFTGGVIHVIDSVLVIPENATSTARSADLKAFAGAVNATGLGQTVDTARDVTIFAPRDEAFRAIGSALPNSTEQLSRILSYHVVNGSVQYSTDLADGQNFTTLNGANLTIHFEDDDIFVNNARVVTPNILVANGVLHIIDNVLNPESSTQSPSPSASSGAPAFTGASSISDTPFTSGQPTPTGSVGTGPTPVTTSSSAGAVPMKTAAVGAAALFGAGAVLLNY